MESVRIVVSCALIVVAMLLGVTAPDRAGKLAVHLVAAVGVFLVALGVLAL